jgi:hypothetical protein
VNVILVLFDVEGHSMELMEQPKNTLAEAATGQMPHLRRAARREHQKLGRTWALEQSGRNGASNATEAHKT